MCIRCLLIYVTDPGRWSDACCSVKKAVDARSPFPPAHPHLCTPTNRHSYPSYSPTPTHATSHAQSTEQTQQTLREKGPCWRDAAVLTPRRTSWTHLSDVICSNLHASSTGGCPYLLSRRFFLSLALHSFSKIRNPSVDAFIYPNCFPKEEGQQSLGWTGSQ